MAGRRPNSRSFFALSWYAWLSNCSNCLTILTRSACGTIWLCDQSIKSHAKLCTNDVYSPPGPSSQASPHYESWNWYCQSTPKCQPKVLQNLVVRLHIWAPSASLAFRLKLKAHSRLPALKMQSSPHYMTSGLPHLIPKSALHQCSLPPLQSDLFTRMPFVERFLYPGAVVGRYSNVLADVPRNHVAVPWESL